MFSKANLFSIRNLVVFAIGLFLASSLSVFSTNQLPSDSAAIKIKKIDVKKIENYRADTDFVYDRVPPPPETLWESFKRWFWKQINKLLYSNEFSNFWDYFQWIIVALLIGLVIAWIFRSEIRAVFKNKKTANIPHFIAANENIHEMDFNSLIENAIKNENFKEAIRLAYLKILKQLTDKDLINWKIDKTNSDYIAELKHTAYQQPFRAITKVFEYVWYGEFEVSSTNFKPTFSSFNELSNKLN